MASQLKHLGRPCESGIALNGRRSRPQPVPAKNWQAKALQLLILAVGILDAERKDIGHGSFRKRRNQWGKTAVTGQGPGQLAIVFPAAFGDTSVVRNDWHPSANPFRCLARECDVKTQRFGGHDTGIILDKIAARRFSSQGALHQKKALEHGSRSPQTTGYGSRFDDIDGRL